MSWQTDCSKIIRTMKIYKVTNSEGQRSWHGTQADAAKAAKAGKGKVEQLESGDGKAGLLDFLNLHASTSEDQVRTVVRITASKPPVDDPEA